eukprot:scaffold66935_cov18-Prasinocladus_malaysianus.AAC.1
MGRASWMRQPGGACPSSCTSPCPAARHAYKWSNVCLGKVGQSEPPSPTRTWTRCHPPGCRGQVTC